MTWSTLQENVGLSSFPSHHLFVGKPYILGWGTTQSIGFVYTNCNWQLVTTTKWTKKRCHSSYLHSVVEQTPWHFVPKYQNWPKIETTRRFEKKKRKNTITITIHYQYQQPASKPASKNLLIASHLTMNSSKQGLLVAFEQKSYDWKLIKL